MANRSRRSRAGSGALTPLIAQGKPVDWWFVFKFNTANFPGCGGNAKRKGIFGGRPQRYKGWSQQFCYASSANPTLQQGKGCVGATLDDPVGATFNQVYNGSCNYVIWNDQFYDAPKIHGCGEDCGSPWGHSKGMLAWDDSGKGFVMQVSTPSWPGSGSEKRPRKNDGNTLGCVKDDNVRVSQHFFALACGKPDIVQILKAMKNASVVTDPTNTQLVMNGGPAQIQNLVKGLGKRTKGTTPTNVELSVGARLIAKPSSLHVPPWQMVSALLGALPLRVASWWFAPEIYSTTARTPIGCWDTSLGTPGAVDIAITGTWGPKTLGLTGGSGEDHNHAKVGVSTRTTKPLTIFGDMNQEGALRKNYAHRDQQCSSSQNGRGGLFFVLQNRKLWESVTKLLAGKSAPMRSPKTKGDAG